MRFILIFSITFIISCCNFSENNRKVVTLRGNTMGTTYLVKIVVTKNTPNTNAIKSEVEKTLTRVNNRLSNWQNDSEISKFNKSSSIEPIDISRDLSVVIQEAFVIHSQSDKKFDVTLSPLISLWGFGPGKNQKKLPTDEQISTAQEKVGMTKYLHFSDKPKATLRKSNPDTSINLSAIAKGYGVDQIATLLKKMGYNNYLVEIGGDLVSSGNNPQGKRWSIGIEKPDVSGRSIQKIVKIGGLGMATSGDYRNYVEKDGKRFSHIIDPTTGKPITHKLASVTVLSNNAMRADGWATALFVLGEDAGLKIAEKHNIAAYFIIRTDNGYLEKSTKSFNALTH